MLFELSEQLGERLLYLALFILLLYNFEEPLELEERQVVVNILLVDELGDVLLNNLRIFHEFLNLIRYQVLRELNDQEHYIDLVGVQRQLSHLLRLAEEIPNIIGEDLDSHAVVLRV